MKTLLAVVLAGAAWEPPPPAVARALRAAPDGCVYAHGYVAG